MFTYSITNNKTNISTTITGTSIAQAFANAGCRFEDWTINFIEFSAKKV